VIRRTTGWLVFCMAVGLAGDIAYASSQSIAASSPGLLAPEDAQRPQRQLTIAGGFTPLAPRNKVIVFRFGSNGSADEKINASYDDIVLGDGAPQNIELKPGPTLVVPAETTVLTP
jgi:polysaccharide export outer membrane protein